MNLKNLEGLSWSCAELLFIELVLAHTPWSIAVSIDHNLSLSFGFLFRCRCCNYLEPLDSLSRSSVATCYWQKLPPWERVAVGAAAAASWTSWWSCSCSGRMATARSSAIRTGLMHGCRGLPSSSSLIDDCLSGNHGLPYEQQSYGYSAEFHGHQRSSIVDSYWELIVDFAKISDFVLHFCSFEASLMGCLQMNGCLNYCLEYCLMVAGWRTCCEMYRWRRRVNDWPKQYSYCLC